MKHKSTWHLPVIVALALTVSSCGSPAEVVDNADTTVVASRSSTTNGAGSDSSSIADVAPWAADVAAAVRELQTARREAADQFNGSWRPGPDELQAQLDLFEADSDAFAAFIAALPAEPNDPSVAASYAVFIARTEELTADVDRIVATLREAEDELQPLLEAVDDPASLGHSAINEITDNHPPVLESWRRACFDLQAEVGDLIQDPIDCIGVDQPTPAGIDVVDPSLIDVSMTCRRGEDLSTLPFDHSVYPWLAALPADTTWASSIVVITNNAETPVQIDTDFRVRYEDDVGAKILEADWNENWAPAFHLRPGQTIYRPGYAFEGLTFALPLRGEELNPDGIAAVFDRLDQCVTVEQPRAVVAAEAPGIDSSWAEHVEITACEPNPDSGRYEATTEVRNPTTDPVRVDVGFEILDAEGTRIGMGGTDGPIRVPAGETGTGVGWSVFYTIVDIETANRCRIVRIAASQ